MSPITIAFFAFIALGILYVILQVSRSGPASVPEEDLSRAEVLVRATAADPKHGWAELGSKTTADGLNLRFDHDDDPEAEALFLVDPSRDRPRSTAARSRTVRLTAGLSTYHVQARGYVFQVRMRGTGAATGKEVKIQMRVANDGTPVGGQIENDDDTDAAVGGWIEIEELEILRLEA